MPKVAAVAEVQRVAGRKGGNWTRGSGSAEAVSREEQVGATAVQSVYLQFVLGGFCLVSASHFT